jgi:hypothetical protein
MTAVEGELALGNRIIDEAAMEAGRDPRYVRHIFDYHGSWSGSAWLSPGSASAVGRGVVTARDRARGQHVHPGRGRHARNPAVWRRGRPGYTRDGLPRAAGRPDADQGGNKEVARKGGKSYLL